MNWYNDPVFSIDWYRFVFFSRKYWKGHPDFAGLEPPFGEASKISSIWSFGRYRGDSRARKRTGTVGLIRATIKRRVPSSITSDLFYTRLTVAARARRAVSFGNDNFQKSAKKDVQNRGPRDTDATA